MECIDIAIGFDEGVGVVNGVDVVDRVGIGKGVGVGKGVSVGKGVGVGLRSRCWSGLRLSHIIWLIIDDQYCELILTFVCFITWL